MNRRLACSRHPFACIVPIALSAVLPTAGAADRMSSAGPQRRIAVAWDESGPAGGAVRAFDAASPWGSPTAALTTGGGTRLRYAAGRVYAVSAAADSITLIRPDDWTVQRVYALGAGSGPQDVAVVGPRTAYVTRAGSTRLLRLDLETGATAETADFAPFADADGNPDMARMAVHAGRVFVQLQRFNTSTYTYALPSYLAVVDAAGGELIDADPVAAGVQPIDLAGRAPRGRMHVQSDERRLVVSASGDFWDAGGIEVIDLDGLQTLGLALREEDGQTGADLGAFTMVSPLRGFLVYSTDLALSSHLRPFTLDGGVDPGADLYVVVDYFVPTIVHEPHDDRLFLPTAEGQVRGVHVFDGQSGERLTSAPIATPGVPTDVALFYTGCWPPADVNGDGVADGRDVQTMLHCLVSAPIDCPCGDLDGSGRTDPQDAALFADWLLRG